MFLDFNRYAAAFITNRQNTRFQAGLNVFRLGRLTKLLSDLSFFVRQGMNALIFLSWHDPDTDRQAPSQCADKIPFDSDAPWGNPRLERRTINHLDHKDAEKTAIQDGNARKLLNIL